MESKYIVGYLPYEVKMVDIKRTRTPLYLTCNNYNTLVDNQERVPILHLLSDLTKEREVNGGKFVPIEWLRKNINGCLRFSDNRFMDYDDGKSKNILHYYFYDVFSDTIDIEEIIELIQKLYEWHFDIHGLIEKGLAIDINQLT